MPRKDLIVPAKVIIGIIIVSHLHTGSCTVARGASIAAAPGIVFEHVIDSKKWRQFDAWGDPDQKAMFIDRDHQLRQFGARANNYRKA
jgi:hypothetical protein